MTRVPTLIAGLALAGSLLTGCDQEPAQPPAVEAPTGSPVAGQEAPVTPPSLTGSGPEQAVQPDQNAELQMAAGVVRLDELTQQGDLTAKLFGTAGGDPAMNGLYTYIAFFDSVPEGWRLFMLGDVLDYTILGEAPGRVDLEITESTMDEATGDIGTRKRKVIVTWTPGEGDTAPATVNVTPAN